MVVTVQCLEGDNNNHLVLPREAISGWVRGQLSEPYVLVCVLKRKQKREDSPKNKIKVNHCMTSQRDCFQISVFQRAHSQQLEKAKDAEQGWASLIS